MTIYDLLNACALDWEAVTIMTDSSDAEEVKPIGTFYSLKELQDRDLLKEEVDTWSVCFYEERGREVCEITICL